jgi:hypothetical protein
MNTLKFLGSVKAIPVALALLLAACGGSNTLTGQQSGGTGTGPTGTPATLTISSDASAILSDGSTTANITALALDANNVLLANIPVTFAATSGGIAVTLGTTNTSGAAKASLSAGGNPGLRTITVTATTGGLKATIAIQVIAKGSSSAVAAVTLTTSASTILSDGSTTATITALVRDASNNLVPNIPVVFSASSGGIAPVGSSTTDASGAATAVLSTAGDPTIRTITVTAKVTTLTATIAVPVVAGTGSVTVQMGSDSGTGGAFVAGTIAASNASLSAGGSTSLQVVLQQSDGTLYTQSATITFSSPCAAKSFATLTPSVTTTTGVATANYVASGCNGPDIVTATTTLGGHSLSATVTLTVAAASIGSIVFVSATPTIISLQGIASSTIPQSSTVIFKVLDQSGNPRPGAMVNFSLNTTVGGIALLNATATTDATGQVQTVVQSGTVATPVRVTATVQNVTPTISTQSSQLIVSTGIPQQNSFSLSVACHNVEAWNIDGVQVSVTARLSDRFNNPVPDGTAVSFHTEGGQIQASCTTTTTNGNSGCAVNWTSQNPRAPADPKTAGDRAGRSSLLAIAIGEESFTDLNGNGAFDNAEPFVDVGERFEDDNENGKWDPGEYFYDFNNNGVHDGPDGFFNGVLCRDTSGRCNGPLSTGIGAQNIIIMSDGVPGNLSPKGGTALSMTAGSSASFAFVFADLNNNPVPAGTTITAAVTGAALSLGQPSSYTVPCTTEPPAYGFIVSQTTAAPGSAILTLTVKSPGGNGSGGITSVFQYPITVM